MKKTAVPPEFPAISKKVYTQLMMLFAHLYHAHFVHLLHLDMEGHLNSFCAHYLSESQSFQLGKDDEELMSRNKQPLDLRVGWWTAMLKSCARDIGKAK